MRSRSRTPDGRFAREIPDGTIDAIALGTVAAGLVVGAADHVPSANAAPADHHATPPIVPPLPEAAATHAAASPPPAHASSVELPSHVDGLSAATAVAQTLPTTDEPLVAPSPSVDATHADTPPPLHETLATIADSFSSAMKTLADHVQSNAPEPDQLSSVIQHVGAMADSAVALANDLGAPALPSLPELPLLPSVTATVDHALGAVSLPELPSLPSVEATVDYALQAVSLPELPSLTSTIDHALQAPSLPELPAASASLDHALGAASPPDLPPVHTDVPAAVLGAPEPVVDHLAAPVVEAPPLQIGFLGQSYTDMYDPHDLGGVHGMGSMLHGMV
jgi:hypothetical protein